MTEFSTRALDNGIQVVRPARRLNMVSAPRLSAVVSDLIAAGHARIVIDLSGTEFIDSSGLGALVSCLKKARQAGGDLRIAGPAPQAQTVFKLTNLDRILKTVPTADVAAAAF
jgi:anti-sigma B factor antagonist